MPTSLNKSMRLRYEYLLVLIAVGGLYCFTVAPGSLWQDYGMAQIRVLERDYFGDLGLALAHPLFYLIAQGFQILPFSESAFKTNLVSAVFGTLTVANIYYFVRLLFIFNPRSRKLAIISALSLAVAHTFWMHAVMSETYLLSSFLLSLELICFLKFIRTGDSNWWIFGMFLNGLECVNHNLALVTLSAVIVWSLGLLWTRKINFRILFLGIPVWLLGCSAYLYMGYLFWEKGEPIAAVIHSMLFGNYEREVLNSNVTMGLVLKSVSTLGYNFPSLTILLIPLGMICGVKLVGKSMYWLLMSATLVHLIFAFRYPVPDQYQFFIMSVFFLAIWLGIGAEFILSQFPKLTWCIYGFCLFPILLYYAAPSLPFIRFPSSPPIPYRDERKFFLQPWKTGYNGPDRLAKEVFASASADSIIIADSTSARPFFYRQLAHKERPDLRIVEGDPFPGVDIDSKVKLMQEFLQTHEVILIRPYPHYCPQWILDDFVIAPKPPAFSVKSIR